tara:strand:+ start:169 stop:840 length:672 start_codon:yes stop_codon:yes gene_type:complete
MSFFGGGKKESKGRTDAGANRTTAYKAGVGNIDEKGKKTKSYKSKNPDAFRNQGAKDIKLAAKKIPTPTLAILSVPLQAGDKANRDFYVDKVLGSKNYKNVSKTEFLSYDKAKQEMMYKSYMRKRTSGETDPYGNPINQGGGRDNNQKQGIEIAKGATGAATITGPKEIQKTATNTITTKDATKKSADAILVATKRKSRQATIKTSATGLTDDYKLSKKKLLG